MKITKSDYTNSECNSENCGGPNNNHPFPPFIFPQIPWLQTGHSEYSSNHENIFRKLIKQLVQQFVQSNNSTSSHSNYCNR